MRQISLLALTVVDLDSRPSVLLGRYSCSRSKRLGSQGKNDRLCWDSRTQLTQVVALVKKAVDTNEVDAVIVPAITVLKRYWDIN